MINAETPRKLCCRCGELKDYSAFSIERRSKDGLRSECRACAKLWREQNADQVKQIYRNSRLRNAEKRKQYMREYNKRNRDYFLRWDQKNGRSIQRLNKWRKENPDVVRFHIAKRKAAKLKAIPTWFDETKVQAIYAQSKLQSNLDGIDYHVDHIVPLVSKIVCGLHWHGNLQVIPKAENLRKKNYYWPDMP